MARPIRETPILFGEDARRFEKRMKNPPLVTKVGKKRIMKAYEVGMKMLMVYDNGTIFIQRVVSEL